MRYDLAVIGSGGAGFAAAIAAATKTATVVMIERGTPGGTCVNTGCVPSKALLAAAEARHGSLDGNFAGIEVSPFGVDLPALIGAKRDLVDVLRTDKYTGLASEYGWDILAGAASFADGPVLEVELTDGGTARVEAEHYLIATGSAPWAPPIDGLADAGYLTSTSAMELQTLPQSMIVLGANAVGLEQAQLWARLGVEVVVVEVLGRPAPFEEPEVSAAITDVFIHEDIGVLTGATVTAVDRDEHGYRVSLTESDGGAGELAAEQLLVATGRRPATAGLNLDVVGVKVGDRGQVVVDEHLRTGNPQIWAAGDVTGAPQFVYVAAAHGALVADNALNGAGRVLDYTALPRVTFTSPAVAAVGLTHEQAVHAGIDCQCRVLPMEYVSRALVNRDTRGLVKIVAEHRSGRILGVSVVAAGAGDAIEAAVYAVQSGMTVTQMADTWAPYLTMAEGLKLAAQTFTRDVTKLSCCAS